jgi:hypothetical protein
LLPLTFALRPQVALGLAVFAVAALGVRPAEACAPAWQGDEPVQIAGEEALIVWDAGRHLEHFVRTATFQGGSATFGFLVPVPTLPELAEADEQIFERIEAFLESQRPEEVRFHFEGLTSFMLSRRIAGVPASAGVTLLAATRVAGMDAVVLEADSAKALGDWLAAREFVFRPELEGWLEPYVRARFKIVAFKYARDAGVPSVGARAVRLTFSTERPFFPYREPRDATRLIPASFRLHVLASTSMSGVLGEARTPWTAAVRYSGPFTAEPPTFARIPTPWITMFEEVAQKRPVAGDLFLEPTAKPSPVAAPPRVVQRTWGIPIELAVLVVLVAGVTVAVIARRSRNNPNEQG